MANVKALKTGNWSDATVWPGGVFPTASDDVYANGFTVQIDGNYTVLSVRTEATTGINAGGGFVLQSGFTLTGNCIGGASTCVTFSAAVGMIVGNLLGGGTYMSGVYNAGAGILTVIGNITGSGFQAYGLYNSAAGTCNVTGSVAGGVNNSNGINNASTGTVNITGNVTGGIGVECHGVGNVGLGTVNVVGNAIGGASTTAVGVHNAGAGTVNILGSAIPSNTAPGARNNGVGAMRVNVAYGLATTVAIVPGVWGVDPNGTTTVREMEFGPKGQSPVQGYVRFATGYSPKAKVTRQNGSIAATDFATIEAELPPLGSVRFGVAYNSGSKTGTVRVPTAANVRAGVPVDNTTGTALLEPAQAWARLTSDITEPNSIGARLKNAATVETTGAQIAALIHQ